MRLAEWRKREGKTQAWLADQLGVTQSYISTIERAVDNIVPGRVHLIRIALLTRLKVLPNDFLPIDDLRRQVMADGTAQDAKDRAA
jgi:transcriptional regulator with XRE-family HTH domain